MVLAPTTDDDIAKLRDIAAAAGLVSRGMRELGLNVPVSVQDAIARLAEKTEAVRDLELEAVLQENREMREAVVLAYEVLDGWAEAEIRRASEMRGEIPRSVRLAYRKIT